MSSKAKNILLALAILSISDATAQTPVQSTDSVYDIVGDINATGNFIIVQPQGMNYRMKSNSEVRYNDNRTRTKDRGDEYTRYSIQIFSENKGHTSQTNAEYRRRLVEQRMPGMHGSVVYEAPYWRVRVGSFRTEAEARSAEKDLKAKFPSFAGDMRIVRIRIK